MDEWEFDEENLQGDWEIRMDVYTEECDMNETKEDQDVYIGNGGK